MKTSIRITLAALVMACLLPLAAWSAPAISVQADDIDGLEGLSRFPTKSGFTVTNTGDEDVQFYFSNIITRDFNDSTHLQINEVYISENGDSWFELVNRSYGTSNAVSFYFSHTTPEDNTFNPVDLSVTASILPGAYVRIHEGSGVDTETDIYLGRTFNFTRDGRTIIYLGWIGTGMTPPSTDDYICLSSYDSMCSDWPAPGQSIGRDRWSSDSDTTADWHYYDTPTPNAANGDDPHLAPWLAMEGGEDTLTFPPGHSYTFELQSSLQGLPPGLNQTVIVVHSNDPVNPIIEVPINLHVWYPEISSPTTALEYTLVPGETAGATVTFTNQSPLTEGFLYLSGGLNETPQLVINEIASDEQGYGYVELFNPSTTTLNPAFIPVGEKYGCFFSADYYSPSSTQAWGKFMEVPSVEIPPGAYEFIPWLGWTGEPTTSIPIAPTSWGKMTLDCPNYADQFNYFSHDPAGGYGRDNLSTDTDSYPNYIDYGDFHAYTNQTLGAPNGEPGPSHWITFPSAKWGLPEMSSKDIPIKVSAAGLVDGDYSGEIKVTTYNYDGPFTIPVTLHVRTGARLSILGTVVDDDQTGESFGNDNGLVEPGESIELSVVLANTGTLKAWNTSAVLTTDDPYVTITDADEFYGIIRPDSQMLSMDDFDFTVAPDCPTGHEINFHLDMATTNGETWEDDFKLTVITDQDGDGLPDHWEEKYSECGLDPYFDDAWEDPDFDGLPNALEYLYDSDPCNPDTDNDCILDGVDNPTVASFGCQSMVVPPGTWRLRVTLLDASASFPSDIYLTWPHEELIIENSLENVGDFSTFEVEGGLGLSFALQVDATSEGLGVYRHYSDSIFGRVTDLGMGRWIIGFEDLPVGMADWDYSDAKILVEIIPRKTGTYDLVSYLGEMEAFSSTYKSGTLVASLQADDGWATKVKVPLDGSTEASVILTNGEPGLYSRVPGLQDIKPLGVFRKVALTNGVAVLDKPATLVFSYPDRDQDGVVDGTAVMEDEIGVYVYDAAQQEWLRLKSKINPKDNQMVSVTSHFSLFAVGVNLNGHQTESSDRVNNDDWFGCAISSAGGSPWSVMPLVLLFAGMFFLRLALKARRS